MTFLPFGKKVLASSTFNCCQIPDKKQIGSFHVKAKKTACSLVVPIQVRVLCIFVFVLVWLLGKLYKKFPSMNKKFTESLDSELKSQEKELKKFTFSMKTKAFIQRS